MNGPISSIDNHTCRLCDQSTVRPFLDLGSMPIANAFLSSEQLSQPEYTFNLATGFCESCFMVQLIDTVDPNMLFHDNYAYFSSISHVMDQHFAELANIISNEIFYDENLSVIEIGSNDGILLEKISGYSSNTIGIEPSSNVAEVAKNKGLKVISEFFNSDLAGKLVVDYSPAQLVVGANVLCHIPDLNGLIKTIEETLSINGIFIFEVSYLADVLEKTLFDTIYHEHLSYHSVGPLHRFFSHNGMNMFGAYRIDTHGGSIRGFCQLADGPYSDDGTVSELMTPEQIHALDRVETFSKFARGIEVVKYELNALLEQLKSDGKKIAGYGAPAKATTLMYHFNIGRDIVDFIVDDSPLKQGLYSPGRHISIVSGAEIEKQSPNFLLVLAWNFAESIISNNQNYKENGGQFIIPLPKVEVR